MTSIADGAVKIQTTPESNIATPSWFGEVVLISTYLCTQGVLNQINEQIRFARKRFGRYELLDFLAALFGYAISGERTLEEFYQRLQPFAIPFMALFDRDQFPSRSALSRFLAALNETPVEALRTLFLDDLLARPLRPDKHTGGLLDRAGNSWTVFDIDGTWEAARQRALPQTDELPPPFRQLDDVCAPGYRGRKRGEVVRGAQRCYRHIVISGWAVSGTEGTGGIGRNCVRRSQPLAGIWRPTSSNLRARWCGSMGNMAMERYSPMWLAARLSPVAKTIASSTIRSFRHACTCPPDQVQQRLERKTRAQPLRLSPDL